MATTLAIVLRLAPAAAEVAPTPALISAPHRAVAITEAGDAVLRDDGRVIGFRNQTGEAKEPVFIAGLDDIVDVAGSPEDGLGPRWPRGNAYWIALRRDGIVLQWDGHCAKEGIHNCSFSPASVVPGLRNVVTIASSRGTHLAVDSDGRAWGWGVDSQGLITTQKVERDRSGRLTRRLIKSPVRIPVPAPLKAITVGFPHSIGIDRTGNVWLWGGIDKPDFQPERSDLVVDDKFIARKVLGIPPALSATAEGPTFVVTDGGELWSWGTRNIASASPTSTREPHKIEGICQVKSVSSASSMVAAVCEDGTVYKMIFPGAPVYDCESCGKVVAAERWEVAPQVKDIKVLHLAYPSNSAVSMIDHFGSTFLAPSFGPGVFLPPRDKIIGPVNIDPQVRK
ncbi:hypothetical protein JQ633_21655 [Bradyrhizobium tropiciagri]|uniref:hypothetical protein n=1 Tax=Bradyrhizobium tropiciagri TaxID=312253 RepID=UPI001BA54F4D|nr:hypothetical protein [Bradyrhizobium tropiciagri]MBR0872977.1 hypothetical protein [Bradyrhizobium tropiciagri]